MKFLNKQKLTKIIAFFVLFSASTYLLNKESSMGYESDLKSKRPDFSNTILQGKENFEDYIEDKMGIEIETIDSVKFVTSFNGYKEIGSKEYGEAVLAIEREKKVSELTENERDLVSRNQSVYYDWNDKRYVQVFFVKDTSYLSLAYSPREKKYALMGLNINNIKPEQYEKFKNNRIERKNGSLELTNMEYLKFSKNEKSEGYRMTYYFEQLENGLSKVTFEIINKSVYWYSEYVNFAYSLILSLLGIISFGREKKGSPYIRVKRMSFFNFRQKRKNKILLKEKLKEAKLINQENKNTIIESKKEKIKTIIEND